MCLSCCLILEINIVLDVLCQKIYLAVLIRCIEGTLKISFVLVASPFAIFSSISQSFQVFFINFTHS